MVLGPNGSGWKRLRAWDMGLMSLDDGSRGIDWRGGEAREKAGSGRESAEQGFRFEGVYGRVFIVSQATLLYVQLLIYIPWEHRQ